MSLNTFFGVACILSFTVPVATILMNRYFYHRSLAALLIYYFILFLDNLMAENFLPVSPSFSKSFGILNNFLDTPLMLTALLFFCPSKSKQKYLQIITAAFLLYEILVIMTRGFRPESIIYVMGPGILIILSYSLFLFIRQVKFSIMHGKNQGRTVMLAAIVFMYASYAFIYYLYYIARTPFKQDVIVLYFIASALSALIISVGLHMMRKRMRELHALKTTRKELALFFSQG